MTMPKRAGQNKVEKYKVEKYKVGKNKVNIMQILKPNDLNAAISLSDFKFKTTAELLGDSTGYQPHIHGWVAQSEAKKSALFGLNMRQTGFNLIVLGEHGSGRSSLMQSAMHEVAKQNSQDNLKDLVAIYDFEQAHHPTLVTLPVGAGA